MGFLVLNTPAAQVTSTVPVNKDLECNVFQVARTDTASRLALLLPADSSIVSIVREGSSVSNAATTAAVTITVANNGGTVSSASDDVKANGATTGFVQMTGLPNVTPVPANGDLSVSVIYAETGGASTLGGPWNYIVHYVR